MIDQAVAARSASGDPGGAGGGRLQPARRRHKPGHRAGRGTGAIAAAQPEDWDTEYLAPILSVRVVDGLEEAVAHINRHGSHHTEAIVTEDQTAAERFLQRGRRRHSSCTTPRPSIADGGEFGMGAEIGISTGKLHARGPVGAEQLTSYKYLVRGQRSGPALV